MTASQAAGRLPAAKPLARATAGMQHRAVAARGISAPLRAGLPAWACPCGSDCPRCRQSTAGRRNSGLHVSQPGEALEAEADRAAETVLRAPHGANSAPTRTDAQIARTSRRPSVPTAGRPLDDGSRRYFEPRFGADFGFVRIHDDARAVSSAAALHAAAYAVGSDIVLGPDSPAAHTDRGRRLMAHELAHIVQQGGGGGRLALRAAQPQLARTPIDLDRLNRELLDGAVTQSIGEIGAGAEGCARGESSESCQNLANPPEDAALPVELEVYQRNTPAQAAQPPVPGPSPGGAAPDTGVPESSDREGIRDAGVPIPTGVPEPDAQPAPTPAPVPAPRSAPPRALVVGGVHGDERGPLDIMAQMRTELRSSTSPLRRDFDTLVIPAMNPGGVADGTRTNRRGVDLNRNFPGLSGFPSPSGPVPARQPEVQAVINVVQTLRPVRILALHAIGSAGTSSSQGGVFADPVEGAARELACRMALRMRGGPLGSGGAATDANTRGNELSNDVCSSRYPETAAVSVTTAQSSLGAWASAPTAVGGRGTTVITHETAGKAALAATGPRSVDAIMPGIREFLLDNGSAASEADALLRGAVSDAFLSGEGATAADRNMLAASTRVVRARFDDMAAHFRRVWAPEQRRLQPSVRLPGALTPDSHQRSFASQSGIMAGQLRSLGAASTDSAIEAAILSAMQTRSMPGFSRHHWGTEIDVIDATRTRWEGAGDLVPVIPFLQTEAQRFGFFHPYTSTPPDPALRHYQDEPWHISYFLLANVFAEQWRARIVGTVLDALLRRTANAVRGRVPLATMLRVLANMRLPEFQSNVAPPP